MEETNGAWRWIDGRPVFIKGATPYEKPKVEKQLSSSGAEYTTDISPNSFKNRLIKAKANTPPEQAWRVDSSHKVKEYQGDQLFAVGKGSCVAVTPDGNIISVCRSGEDADTLKGRQLLEIAIAHGGKKLDAFGKRLFLFYTRNGFEPVSWTPFDYQYKPPDWVEGRDEREPVIFYRYTGKKISVTYEEFLASVQASKDYGSAERYRNDSMKRG